MPYTSARASSFDTNTSSEEGCCNGDRENHCLHSQPRHVPGSSAQTCMVRLTPGNWYDRPTEKYYNAVRPLWEHTVSFADAHGPGSLFFVGNIMSTSYRFSNAVQAALIAWILADPSILPSREDMLRVVAEEEARTVALGRAVEKLGHRQGAPSSGESEVYQRRMLAYLQSKGIETGSVHDQTGVVLEPWRVEVRKEFWRIMRGWARLEKEGRTKQMIAGLEGEQAYADLCVEVLKEQTIVEKDRDPNESEISGWH